MYKLTSYKEKIEAYYNTLINQHNLTLIIEDYKVLLKGIFIKIEIRVDRYYPDLQIIFKENKKHAREISIGDVLEKKGLMNETLLEKEEIEYSNQLNDEIENGLYCFSIIINKYCRDILLGEFLFPN